MTRAEKDLLRAIERLERTVSRLADNIAHLEIDVRRLADGIERQTGGNRLPEKILWSCEEAGAAVGKTADTVRKWCQSGEIHALKINNAWRIPYATMDALAAGRVVPGDPEVYES